MPIHITEEGKIVYYAYPNGDRVPDFSYCGYQRSEHPIPYIEESMFIRHKVMQQPSSSGQLIMSVLSPCRIISSGELYSCFRAYTTSKDSY